MERTTRLLMNEVEMEDVRSTTPIEGAANAIERLRAKGLKVAVLTRGSRAYTLASLKVSGMTDIFDAIVCRDDFPESEAKPNGKAMRRVAAQMKIEVGECVLLGDHEIDLRCARESGAGFIGVLSGAFDRSDWSGLGCDVIDSVAELDDLIDGRSPR